MRIRRLFATVFVSALLILAALPVLAAQDAEIKEINVIDDCTIEVVFRVEDEGAYFFNVWDDGNFIAGAGANVPAGATVTVRFTADSPVLNGATGIGLYVENGLGLAASETYAANGSFSPPGSFGTTCGGNTPSISFVNIDAPGDGEGPPCENLFDGRINAHQGLDCAAPVAIYPEVVDVYAVNPDTGDGSLAVRLTEADLQPETTDSNVLLAQTTNVFTGQVISVYWLTSNEIQVSTRYADGKPYIVVWPVDNPSALYHLAS
jgi:hypothetical protein